MVLYSKIEGFGKKVMLVNIFIHPGHGYLKRRLFHFTCEWASSVEAYKLLKAAQTMGEASLKT